MRKCYRIKWKNYSLELGTRTHIMGVLNITPDSFSDGGRFYSYDSALAHAEEMIENGADILDIGGESTRPFSQPVSADEERKRVIPVIEKLAPQISIPISIDTKKAEVAKSALDAGASIINDISSLRLDPNMVKVAADYDVPVILMHMKGTPDTMQVSPTYENLIEEIKEFLDASIQKAIAGGISASKIMIDPGIGFGKTLEHNLSLIHDLDAFQTLDVPIIIGTSRKAFIRNILKDKKGKPLHPDMPEVENGTQATIAAAILNGAHIVRVHNVANTLITAKIIDAILNEKPVH